MKFDLRQYLSENKLMKEQQDAVVDKESAVNYVIDYHNIDNLEEALEVLREAGILNGYNDFVGSSDSKENISKIDYYFDTRNTGPDDSDVPDDVEPLPEPDDQAVELPDDQSVDTLNYEETEVDKKLLELIESELNIAQKDTADYRKRYVDAVVKVENDTVQEIQSNVKQRPIQVPDAEELKQSILTKLIDGFEEKYGIKMMEGDSVLLAEKAEQIANDSVIKVIQRNNEILGVDASDEEIEEAGDSVKDAVESVESDKRSLEESLRDSYGDDVVDSVTAGDGDGGDVDGGDDGGTGALIGGLLGLVAIAAGASIAIALLIFGILALYSLLKPRNRNNLQESQLETLVEYELRKSRMLNEEEKEQLVTTTRSKRKTIMSNIYKLSFFTGAKALVVLVTSLRKLYQLYTKPQETSVAEVTSFVNEIAAKLQDLGEKEQKNKEAITNIISELTGLGKE